MTYRAVRVASLPLLPPTWSELHSDKDFMSRLSTILIAAAMGATLAIGCTSPTDENASGQTATEPAPGGDGTVTRMALPGGPLGIAVASEGFAYITQPNFGQSPGVLARVDLNARAVTASIPVGMVPSLVIFNATRTRAYVSNQWSDNVGIIDVASNTQTDVISTTGDPFALALSPDGTTLLVTTNVNRLFKFNIAIEPSSFFVAMLNLNRRRRPSAAR